MNIDVFKKAGLVPKLFTVIKEGYTFQQFFKDLTAGIIVGIIALPLSIALGIASGVSPEKGIFTAIIAGFIISFMGGSRVQIGGPTGAFVVIVYGVVDKYGISGLITATFMAGVFLVIMGLLRFGSIIKYIPFPITTGFTSGIAVSIFSTQIKDFFGLGLEKVPAEFLEKLEAYIEHAATFNLSATIIGIMSLAILILWPGVTKKIPGSVIAILASVLAVRVFGMEVETIGSKFGVISSQLPTVDINNFDFKNMGSLIAPAFTIAMLAGIESLLSAVVADGMIGTRHRSNMELIAQGFGNIGSALFGGIPATGAIARTAANVKNGGRTPVAGIVHSVVVLLIMLVLMPYVSYIPMATLAAILIIVAYNMGEWREFIELPKAPKSDAFVFVATFSLTVMIDLVVAIEVGMILASLLFMKRMADVTDIKAVVETDDDIIDMEDAALKYKKRILDKIMIYEINGPFFFGAADKFLDISTGIHDKARALILKIGRVPAMDATGFHALEIIYDTCRKKGIRLILVKVQEQPFQIMEKYGFIKKIGRKNIHENIDEAMEDAVKLIDKHIEILDINQIIANTGAIFELKGDIGERGIKINYIFGKEIFITGDDNDIFQIMDCMMENAVEALDKKTSGEKIITIKTYSDKKAHYIALSDNGNGIPEDVLPHIFEYDYTSKEGEKSHEQLSLFDVIEILQKYRAGISVDSKINIGTTFTIRIPREQE